MIFAGKQTLQNLNVPPFSGDIAGSMLVSVLAPSPPSPQKNTGFTIPDGRSNIIIHIQIIIFNTSEYSGNIS